MLPSEAFRSEIPDTPASSRFGTLGLPSATPTPQASSTATTPAAMRPRSLRQLMRLAETQHLTVEQLITQLNQEKESISSELDILSARINRLRDTGTEEGIIRSVETAMKENAQQYEKLEEELKLLRVRAFSMATPREDTRRSRATGKQPAVPENEEEQQKKAKEALQIVQRLEPEAVQQVNPVGLKKLIKLFLQSLRRLATQAIETLVDLAPPIY